VVEATEVVSFLNVGKLDSGGTWEGFEDDGRARDIVRSYVEGATRLVYALGDCIIVEKCSGFA
jgi:hypothetical protein